MAIFGKSYVPLIFSAILLILGVMILESLPKENLLGNPIYYLSAFLIVLGIFIPYWIHNILENRVDVLKNRLDELEEFFGIKPKKSNIEKTDTPLKDVRSSTTTPKKISDIVMFIAALSTIGGLAAIYFEFIHAEDEIKNTRESVNNLGKLVTSSNIALSSINKTSTEISHQTVLEAFAIEGNHFMKAHDCGASTTYPQGLKNNAIFYQEYGVNPEIMTEKGVESVIPYYAYFDFWVDFSNSTTKKETKLQLYPAIPLFLINPESPQSFPLNITVATSIAKKYDADKIRIDLDYGFAPYSGAINSNLVSYVNNFTGIPLIEYSLTSDGWNPGDGEGICKQ